MAAFDDNKRSIDSWHLELSIVQQGFSRLVQEFDDDSMSSIAHVLNLRFLHLVESFPFAQVEK